MNWDKYAPYFTEDEFRCKHTGKSGMDEEFMDKLLVLRIAFGKPMVITSGYRHWSHPVEVRKGHKNGEHTQGRCIDVRVTQSRERFELLKLAFDMEFPRFGIHDSFLHIGLGGDGLANNVVWDYK